MASDDTQTSTQSFTAKDDLADQPPAVSVRNVTKTFRLSGDRPQSIKEMLLTRTRGAGRDFRALDDVTLDVPQGSFFGLIGHNGSGKSTLLRLMAGIHRPNSGTIEVSGRVSALLELGSGFHPDLTGRENIYLNGAILGIPQNEMAQSVQKIIDFSGIGDFIDVPIKAYSSGMYVRLGFAVAVNVNPEILLVDEVIAVGDEDFQRRCLDHMYRLRRQGTTIIFVSHGISMVQQLCDRVAWMDHGKLQMVGDPAEVCNAYLAHVNQIESNRIEQEISTAEASTEVAPETVDAPRRGSGDVRVSSVELLEPSTGERLEVGISGRPFSVRVHFDAAERIESPVFIVDIFHESGTHVTGPNNQAVDCPFDAIEAGPGSFDFIVDSLELNPGNFYLSTAAFDSTHLHCYDHWLHAASLIVQPGESAERAGLVPSRARFVLNQPAT